MTIFAKTLCNSANMGKVDMLSYYQKLLKRKELELYCRLKRNHVYSGFDITKGVTSPTMQYFTLEQIIFVRTF